ncbi:LexA family protein [Streptomyces sp. NPDC001492]
MARPAFPLDLIQAQRDWNRVHAALERRPVPPPALRRRLEMLSVRIAVHPFWETEAGRATTARGDLRRRVQELEEAESRLTDQQQRILACIRDWIAEHGEPPTLRQIGHTVGLSSTGSVSYQITKLERLGVIDRRSNGRGIAPRS